MHLSNNYIIIVTDELSKLHMIKWSISYSVTVTIKYQLFRV